MQGIYFEDLTLGQSAEFGKTVTEADIVMFAGVTGDTNPVHLNQPYAESTLFKGRIAHGMLSAGLISAVLGTRLPGPGTIYLSQSLKFRAPVRIGDTVYAKAEVSALDPEKKRVTLTTTCKVGEQVVLEGEATVIAPSRA